MKYKKKRLVSMEQPWKTEAWLSKMAENGYLLREVKKTTYSFEQTASQAMEYRIVFNKECDFGQRIMHYKEMGWDVVARDDKIIILGAKTYHRPSEEYFQEDEREQWKRKDRTANICGLFMGVLFMYIFMPDVFSLHTLHIINWHSLNANWSSWLSGLSVIILLVGLLISCLNKYRYIKRIDTMGAKAHQGNGRRPVRVDMLIGKVFFVASMIAIVIGYQDLQREEENESAFSNPPIIQEQQLAEIIGGAPFTRDFPKSIYGVFTDGYVATFGCEEKREDRDESGSVVNQYNVMNWCITQEYHKMKNERYRNIFMNSIIYDKQMIFDGRDFKKIKKEVREVDGLDRVIYIKGKDGRYAFAAAKGPHILYVEVEKDMEEQKVLDLMKANLLKL